MKEIWKTIKINHKYSISNFGRVKHNKSGRIRKLSKNKSNYVYICLSYGKIRKSESVHRLVATHFINNPKNKKTVNHIDGNKNNNHVSNLEWTTQDENVKHAMQNNLREQKLTHYQVNEIRRLYKNGGFTYKKLSEKYKISQTHVYNIINFLKWKNVKGENDV